MKKDITDIIADEGNRIHCLANSAGIYDDIARQMADKLKENNSRGTGTLFILPVGPRGQYVRFAKMCNNEKISCRNLMTINMDEFLDQDDNYYPETNPFSFRGFMKDNLFKILDDKVRMRDENIIFPDPGKPDKIFKLIDKHGGADICFAGAGINGHVAFNEPVSDDIISLDEFKKLKTRTLDLAYETVIMTSLKHGGYVENVPRRCITIGMAEILLSKEVRVYLEHPHQAAIFEKMVFSRPSPEIPVTILKEHPGYKLFVSREVVDSYKRNRDQ